MIQKRVMLAHRDIFIDISETPEEFVRLENLSRQVKYCSTAFKRTGLYLALEHKTESVIALALCLNRPIELSSAEEKEILEVMQIHSLWL